MRGTGPLPLEAGQKLLGHEEPLAVPLEEPAHARPQGLLPVDCQHLLQEIQVEHPEARGGFDEFLQPSYKARLAEAIDECALWPRDVEGSPHSLQAPHTETLGPRSTKSCGMGKEPDLPASNPDWSPPGGAEHRAHVRLAVRHAEKLERGMVGQDPVRSGGSRNEVAIRDEVLGRHPAGHRRVELLGHPLQAPLAQVVFDPFQGRRGILAPTHGASQLLKREYGVLREEILGCEHLDLTIRRHSGDILPLLEAKRQAEPPGCTWHAPARFRAMVRDASGHDFGARPAGPAAIKRETLGQTVMQRTGVWIGWPAVVIAAIAIIVLLPLREFFMRYAPHDDWSQFKSDFLAAFIAVVLGVPAGLWINRIGEAKRREQEQTERRKRLRLVLEGLIAEVRFNQRVFEGVLGHQDEPHRFLPLLDCRTQFWDAISASGNLAVVEDAALVSQVAVAYHMAHSVNAWRRPLRDAHSSLDARTDIMVMILGGTTRSSTKGAEAIAAVWPHLVEATREAARIHDTTLQRLQQALQATPADR